MDVLLTLFSICLFVSPSFQQVDLQELDDGDSCQSLTESFVLNDRKFIFFTQRVTWDEANIICPSYKAHLAVPNSALKATWLTKTWAQSDLVYIDSMWIGARKSEEKTWTWVTEEVVPVPEQQGNKYPYWKRHEFRTGKNCMALMRFDHKDPAFADLYCGLTRPFICETHAGNNEEPTAPLPTTSLKCKTVFYTLYSAEVPWTTALAFCRSHGKRLARLRDATAEWQMRVAMTKSRPALEMIWLAGHNVNGHWSWVTDGTPIPMKQNKTIGYPPWLDDRESSKEGCLVFDKHFCNPAAFVSLECNKKRSFACEEVLVPAPPLIKELIFEFPCGLKSCLAVGIKKTWFEAQRFCRTVYKTSLVKMVNREHASLIADAMADHPSELKHVWIGGYHPPQGEWMWVSDNSTIPLKKTSDENATDELQSYFPPWCFLETKKVPKEGALCLNLDRTIYRSYIMYGMECNTTQAFVCQMEPGK